MKAHKLGWYRRWHGFRFHHYFHVAMLVFYTLSIILGSLGVFTVTPPKKTLAASTYDWDLSTSTDYTYDSNKIEFVNGKAQLKAQNSDGYTPGVDWISSHTDLYTGWDEVFRFRRPITITNPNNTNDYQVQITGLDTEQGGKVHSYCNDLRFTSDNGVTRIPFYVESASCPSPSTTVWVKVPAGQTTIYMYYGSSVPWGYSDDQTTFEKVIGNVQGAWKMDETSGNVVAGSSRTGTGYDGAVTGTAPPYAGGKFGYARGFAGGGTMGISNGTASSLNITNNFSTSAWVYTTSNTNYQPIILKGRTAENTNYALYLYPDNILNFTWINGGSHSYFSTVGFAKDGWHHIAVTFSKPTLTFYIDGVQRGTFSDNTNLGTISRNVEIGHDTEFGNSFLGYIDELKVYNTTVLSQDQITALADPTNQNHVSYFSPSLHPLTEYLIEYSSPTPSASVGAETGYSFFVTDKPTVTDSASHKYNKLKDFMTSFSDGDVKYQVSNDDGVTWYWFNTDTYEWEVTTGGYEQANNHYWISGYIPQFTGDFGSGTHDFKWRAFLPSNGSQQTALDNVQIKIADTVAPDNVASVSGFVQEGGGTINSGEWHNGSDPYFTWTQPNDNADTVNGETPSGIDGYTVCLSTNPNCTPNVWLDGSVNYIKSSDLGVTPVSGQTYYLRMKTWDKDHQGWYYYMYPGYGYHNQDSNASSVATLFTYKYDGNKPTNPSVERSPVGWSDTNSFDFTWSGATDTGGSGIKGYEYKRATDNSWTYTTGTSITGIQAYQNGTNVFQIRTLDNAGNTADNYTSVNYYYAQNAPSVPQNLSVNPQNNTANSFNFTWQLPASYNGGVKGYRWSVNALPSSSNTVYTTDSTTGAIPAATQQGLNTFYVVAIDTQDDVNYSNYASVQFEADTTAPGIPLGVLISDISNRNSTPVNWALALSWNPPSSGGAVDHYIIQRSTDQVTWVQVGTSSSTDFAEAGLDNTETYYYRVIAVDSADKQSAFSSTVSKKPTGNFATHPDIRPPDIQVTATSATITWSTDRASSSFVKYGKTTNYGASNGSPDGVTMHTVTISGLEPGITYHYRQQSYDEQRDYDINSAVSEDMNFKTLPAPGISEVRVSDISLSSAIVTWKTTSSATSTLKYGKTNEYGAELSDVSGSAATTHTVKISGLNHSSTYHFKIFAADTDGNQMHSDDYNFDTLTFPTISNVRFQQMKNTVTSSLKVSWDSNVPISSTLQYVDATGKKGEMSQAQLTNKHELVLSGLKDNNEYRVTVRGRDAYGNEVVSDNEKIKTDFDTRPPEISEVIAETSIKGYGVDAKSQMVISWYTDEPATSQVEYAKGVSGDTFSLATKEDAALTTSHVVVVSDLDPSSAYYFRVISRDDSKNEAKSETNSVLTEQAQSSVLDIVIQSFMVTLGWLFGGGK